MKCRAKKEMKYVESTPMRRGRSLTQGVCSVCGTKMFIIAIPHSQPVRL